MLFTVVLLVLVVVVVMSLLRIASLSNFYHDFESAVSVLVLVIPFALIFVK